ncbi:hypothetical protein ACFL6S_08360 [Candidatus Poribacteria bacterium]
MGFLVVGFVIVMLLAILGTIVSMAGSAISKKKAKAIIKGETTATVAEINRLIDSILRLNKSPKEEERDLVEKLRLLKQEIERDEQIRP